MIANTTNKEIYNIQCIFPNSYTTIYSVATVINSDQFNSSSSNSATINLGSINVRTGGINRLTSTGFYFNVLAKSSNSGHGVGQWISVGLAQ